MLYSMIRVLLIVAFVLTSTSFMKAQDREPNLWWTYVAPRQVSYHPHWGYLALIPGAGLFRGDDPTSLNQYLSDEEWIRIRALPKMTLLNDGTLLIAGGTQSLETGGTMFLRDAVGAERVLGLTELDSMNIGGGFENDNMVASFEPDGFVVMDAYSTNKGVNWHKAVIPDSLSVQNGISVNFEFVTRHPRLGYVAFSPVDTAWKYLALPEKRWKTTTAIPSVGRDLVFLKGGRAVAAMQTARDIYTGIATGDVLQDEWQFHERASLRTAPFSSTNIYRVRQQTSNVILKLSDSLVAMPLDSGRLVCSNGIEVWMVKLNIPDSLVNVGKSNSSYSVVDNVLYLSYSDKNGSSPATVAYNVETGTTTVLQRLPQIERVQNHIVANTSAGLLGYNPATDTRYPLLRVRSSSGDPILPVAFNSITVHNDSVYTFNNLGNVVGVNTWDLSAVLATWMRPTTPSLSIRQMELGFMPCVSTSFGLLQTGSRGLLRIQERTVQVLRSDTTSCVASANSNQLLCGYRTLHISLDGAATWQAVRSPYQDSVVTPVISSCLLWGDTIVVAYRGYHIETDGTPSGVFPGGIFRSLDRGSSWERCSVPGNTEWFESLHRSSNGTLYCWAIDRYLERSGSTGRFVHNNHTLLRSTDDGASWQAVHLETRVQNLSKLGAWHISSNNNRIVVNTDNAVLGSDDNGNSFSELEELPFGTIVTGAGIDGRGVVWASTEKGIYRISNTTRISNTAPTSYEPNQLTVAPNPNAGEFVLQSTLELPHSIGDVIVTNQLGMEVSFLSHGNTIILDAALSSGLYNVRVRLGNHIVGTVLHLIR